MLPINLPKSVSTFGKPTYQLATELLGNPSNFREIAEKYGITPFDPQNKIDQLIKLASVQESINKLGALNTSAIETFTQVKKAANDIVKLDWLMN